MRTLPISTSQVSAERGHASINPWTDDFCRRIELEMVAILESPFFRSSRRSCQFLRHVVSTALEGRADSLKERAIGIEVLGRDASYDTGSDAAVRVRANDVRKRLGSYYEQNPSRTGFRIELPAGSYVPQFVKTTAERKARPDRANEQVSDPTNGLDTTEITPVVVVHTSIEQTPTPIPFLTLRHLATPTVLALFVCAISIRYQLLGTTPFHMFWSDLLRGKSQLTVIVERAGASVKAVNLDQVQASLPLLNLAQAFQVQPVIQNSDAGETIEHDTVVIRLTNQFSPRIEADPRVRLLIRSDKAGIEVVDKLAPARHWVHVALITVLPDDTTPVISVGATDTEALRVGTRLLTDRSAFPQLLLNSVRTSEITQALVDERGEPIPFFTQGRN